MDVGTVPAESVWSEGDFSRISGGVVLVGELLCESAELRALERVLDVGCANGNLALSAARRRCTVVGVDPVPKLLDHARRRAEAEGLKIDFREGRAEALAFPDGSFDAVVSSFGVAFASDAEAAAREMARVCRPGGRIALANWTERGSVGETFRAIRDPLRAVGIDFDPLQWADPDLVARWLGEEFRVRRVERLTSRLRSDSVEINVAGLERFLPPVTAAFRSLDTPGRERLRAELTRIVRERNTARDGTVLLDSEYVELVAEKTAARQAI